MNFDIFEITGLKTNFGTLDWIIVGVYLLIIAGVGVYLRRFVKSVGDFMVAGRQMRTFLGVASMIGTELGLITVVFAAQKGYTSGFAAFHIAMAAAIGALIVGITGFIIVPLRRMRIMTMPEFYEKRFGKDIRIFGGIILAFSGILNMGMFLKAGSLFIIGITGLTSGTELKIIMSILLAMVLLYTTLGGMVSIVILDYIQFVILSFSLVATSLLALNFLGWNNIVETVVELQGEGGFNPLVSEGFGLTYVVWMLVIGGVGCAVWQPVVIRACSAKDTKTVRKMFTLASIGFLIRFLLPYFFGIAAFVYIAQNDVLRPVFMPEDGVVDPQLSLMAMPIFLSQILPAGFIGLITAGMLAAFMSTHDCYLLCWSSVLTQDVIAPWFKDGLSDKTRLLLTRIFIVLIGIFILVWGLWYPLGQDLWDYMVISASIYGAGALTLMTFAIYWKRTSKVGAYLALIAGFCSILGLKPVQGLFGLDISTAVVGLGVVGGAIVLLVIGSLLFPDKGPAFNIKDHQKEQ